jgi:hypothetical protein
MLTYISGVLAGVLAGAPLDAPPSIQVAGLVKRRAP